jgi:hypothetical protein
MNSVLTKAILYKLKTENSINILLPKKKKQKTETISPSAISYKKS